MDMARKFLQMGWTCARRYANHKSGQKYSSEELEDPKPIGEIPPYKSKRNREHHLKVKTKKVLPLDPDPEKARSAEIFYQAYSKVKNDPAYLKAKAAHLALFERPA